MRDLSVLAWLIPVLVAFMRRNDLDISQRRIVLVILAMMLSDGLTYVLRTRGEFNLWVYHIYVPLLLLLISNVYIRSISKLAIRKRLKIVTVILLLLCLVESMVMKGVGLLNSVSISATSLFYLGLGIFYFHQRIRKSSNAALTQKPVFWMNIGLLVYYASTFVLFIFYDKVIINLELFILGWTLNAIFYLFLIGCYSLALWVKPRT